MWAKFAVAYSMQWNNPHPELEIKSIDLVFGPDRRAIPALLAITAARDPTSVRARRQYQPQLRLQFRAARRPLRQVSTHRKSSYRKTGKTFRGQLPNRSEPTTSIRPTCAVALD